MLLKPLIASCLLALLVTKSANADFSIIVDPKSSTTSEQSKSVTRDEPKKGKPVSSGFIPVPHNLELVKPLRRDLLTREIEPFYTTDLSESSTLILFSSK